MYTPEDRQKHVLEQRHINVEYVSFPITCLPVEGAGQSRAMRLPCAVWALEASAGHTLAVRPVLVQNLFLFWQN